MAIFQGLYRFFVHLLDNFVNAEQFWKEFFESSANVSLAGYEELNAEEAQQQQLTQDERHQNQSAEASQVTADEYSATMEYDLNTEMRTPPRQSKNMDEEVYMSANMTGVDDDDSSFVAYAQQRQDPNPRQQQQRQQRQQPQTNRNGHDISRFKYEDEEELEIEATLAGATQFMKSLNLDNQSTPRTILADRSDIVNGGAAQNGMQWADMVSPFEEMRTELKATTNATFDSTNSLSIPQVNGVYDDDLSLSPPKAGTKVTSSSSAPRTPNRYSRPANSTIDEEDSAAFHTPESSPFSPYAGMRAPNSASNYNKTYIGGSQQKNVLLHRVLDRKWGIQATPKQPSKQQLRSSQLATPKNNARAKSYQARFDSSPMDSPPAVTQLTSNIFSSPERD